MNETTNEIVRSGGENLPIDYRTQAEIGELLFDPARFQAMNMIAEIMASGTCTVPRHLAGNKGDCFAIVMQSAQWGMNPYAVAQKTHIVSGSLGYEAQLVNAVVEKHLRSEFEYEWFGDWSRILGKFAWREGKNGKYQVPGWNQEDEVGLGVRVWNSAKPGKVLELLLVQATVRNSTLWASDPKQQLAYLAVKRWSRLYCPGAILGVYTPDELAEVRNGEPRDVTPPEAQPQESRKTATQSLKERLGVKPKETDVEKLSAEPPKAKEPETPKESLAQKIDRIIAEKNAPVTLADVLKYINTKSPMKIYTMGDLEKTYKGKMYDDTESLVDHAAEWAEGIGNAEQQ